MTFNARVGCGQPLIQVKVYLPNYNVDGGVTLSYGKRAVTVETDCLHYCTECYN